VVVEVTTGGHPEAARVAALAADLASAGVLRRRRYILDREPPAGVLDRIVGVVADPVTDVHRIVGPDAPIGPCAFDVAYLPGVTDTDARQLEGILAELGAPGTRVVTSTVWDLGDGNVDAAALEELAAVVANETVERVAVGRPLPPVFVPAVGDETTVRAIALSSWTPEERLVESRRRLWSLDAAELEAVVAFFAAEDRDPTDGEMETIAQTWSEHCSHKTFRAVIDFTHVDEGGAGRTERIEGLLGTHLRAATDAVAADWVVSAFVDDAGIITVDGIGEVAIKVETHNHPSALEPFGGAATGVGGVVRDVLGVVARPVATLDVLCFAPVGTPTPAGSLSPGRIAAGVVAGIGDYGNKLGLPTLAGAVVYDAGYAANPLVYCGAVGVRPAGTHLPGPAPGDLVVVLGGETGRDGIHGATFSSIELDAEIAEIAGAAVQIGDPITEKGLIEIIDDARDAGWIRGVTDCGAGGFSSAIGELGAATGVQVDVALAPRKYPGLAPWEVWVSEAQERMVVAVRPDDIDALAVAAVRRHVDMCVLGEFRGDGRIVVTHGKTTLVDLPSEFLHEGRPRRHLSAQWTDPPPGVDPPPPTDWAATLDALLSHPTVATKEGIFRTYDHEVRGGTVVGPACGPGADGPSDGTVFVPLGADLDGVALALGLGIRPSYGTLDPYRMAHAVLDEAVRNLVVAGADPDRIAVLDNFCWGDVADPEELGALVRASEGCRDAAVAYGTPFVSGKDSLNNTYEGVSIPRTLLITGLAPVPAAGLARTSALTAPGNVLVLVGATAAELGGSVYAEVVGVAGRTVPAPITEPRARYRAVHAAIRAGLVQAAHDLSEGGLLVAAAEMCIAGRLGASLEVDGEWWTLLAESSGRILLEVAPDDVGAVGDLLAGVDHVPVGTVSTDGALRMALGGETLLDVGVEDLARSWGIEP
jgi:phosphoribosylformylglycinamidine synthase